MIVFLAADLPTASEAAAFARSHAASGVGFAVGPRLLTRSGVAAVTALAEFGPVLADVRLGGSITSVAAAARSLAAGGATRVTIGPGCGPAVIAGVVETLRPYGAVVVVVPVHPEGGDSDVDVVTAGAGRGRVVSRVAGAIADLGGVEILGRPADVGVVAQVAGAIGVVVAGVSTPAEVDDARARGASGVVLSSGAVDTDPATLAPFVTAAG